MEAQGSSSEGGSGWSAGVKRRWWDEEDEVVSGAGGSGSWDGGCGIKRVCSHGAGGLEPLGGSSSTGASWTVPWNNALDWTGFGGGNGAEGDCFDDSAWAGCLGGQQHARLSGSAGHQWNYRGNSIPHQEVVDLETEVGMMEADNMASDLSWAQFPFAQDLMPREDPLIPTFNAGMGWQHAMPADASSSFHHLPSWPLPAFDPIPSPYSNLQSAFAQPYLEIPPVTSGQEPAHEVNAMDTLQMTVAGPVIKREEDEIDSTESSSPTSQSTKDLEIDEFDAVSTKEADQSSATAESPAAEAEEYDTCFGLLEIEDISSHLDDSKEMARQKAAKLDFCGSAVIVRDTQSGAYAGLVGKNTTKALLALRGACRVSLSASLRSAKGLSIIVYGLFEESERAGDLLAEHSCYLQRPDSFDSSVPYQNPQSFSLPGVKIEPLVAPTPGADGRERSKSALLDSTAKSRVSELLDSATGPEEFKEVQASDKLTTPLKIFQKKALAMMVEKEAGKLQDTEFPSVWTERSSTTASGSSIFYNNVTKRTSVRRPQLCLGGLLADDMGLGKSLTTLTLIAGSLDETNRETRRGKSTLIVTPLSTLPNWQDQIRKHFKKDSVTFTVYHGPNRYKILPTIERYDVILTTYETLKADCPNGHSKKRKATSQGGAFYDISWHRVVLDEAHVIRNCRSQSFKAVYALPTRHRWCLTGTPIQNTIEDLGSLVKFLRISPFDDSFTFKNLFVSAATENNTHKWKRLRCLVGAMSLRRTKHAVRQELQLPNREEIVEHVSLDAEERTFYDLLKRHFVLAIDSGGSPMNCFQLILRLRQVCDHGAALLPPSLRGWLESARSFVTDSLPLSQLCEECGAIIDIGKEAVELLECFHQICGSCLGRRRRDDSGSTNACPVCDSSASNLDDDDSRAHQSPSSSMSVTDCPTTSGPSSKVTALIRNLTTDREASIASGDVPPKSVVFSSWTGMLDLIGKALSAQWFRYQRLDGSRTLSQRETALREFRSDPTCEVLLVTLGTGGVGLDLTAATRVHLMEPGWNPMLERQALDRIHRLGQTKEVISRCYVVQGKDSIDEYILLRQRLKLEVVASCLGDDKREQITAVLQDFRQFIVSRVS